MTNASPKDSNDRIVDLLIKCYNAELETVMNYIANSTNLEGVRAERIKDSLAADITEELGHAQLLAKRIHTLEGMVPGSQGLRWSQDFLQPHADTTDVVAVIRGVIAAEEAAITGYRALIELCDGVDPVTEDLAVTLLADEEEHRRTFIGFLKEYTK